MCISASRARALAAAALLAAVTSLFSVTATSQAATTTVGLSPALAGLAGQLQTSLLSDMDGSSPSDGNFYSDGAWYAPDGPACWFCYDTAADGAATLSQIDDNPALAQVAIDTFTTAIADHQLPSGEFTDDSGDASQVDTGFIAVDLGVAYLELYSDLSSTTRSAWSTALGNAASYLINSGATTWYINGNVNLRQTEVMWLAWTATQNPTFLTAYNSEWTFTISPSQTRWPGYGLQITQPTTNSDGVGGSGYLAESNTGTDPGFDPNYTQAQLDTATDLYVLTRDPRYLWLMNLEYDQLQPLVSSSWVLNATGGTRDSFMEPFNTPALAVLAASGTRPDLVADVGPQLAATEADYQQTYNLANVNYYKGFESLAMPLLEVQWPQGMSAATSLSTTPTAVVATPTTTSTTPTTTSTTPTAPTPTTGTTPTTTTPKPTTTTPSPAAAPTTPKSTPAPSASPPKTGTPTATKKITATVATAGTTVRSTHLNVTRLRRVKKKAKRSHGRHKPKHVRRV